VLVIAGSLYSLRCDACLEVVFGLTILEFISIVKLAGL
jgi:hypothetical protein